MLYYLALGLGGLLAILFLRFTRQWLYKLAEDSVSVLDILLNSEEDDIKLKQMQTSTGQLVRSLVVSIGLILSALVLGYLPVYTLEILQIEGPLDRSALWEVVSLSVGASIPFFISLPRGASNYSELSILLHRLILNNYTIGLRLLSIELKNSHKKGLSPKNEFVIITGLARAGTTSIMNQLINIPNFSSLNYGNMPFLLSPNLWAKIYKPKNAALKERSHGDGIQIGLNSAEALEEYYFKSVSQDKYIREASLVEYKLPEEDYVKYLNYQRVICGDQDRVYLAKNNNFLLRYRSVREQNPHFLMVIMFRRPLYHATSLLEKHLEYKAQQTKDPFILEYMNWLGHHEFGLNQKCFEFNSSAPPVGNRETLDYWLRVWLNYYSSALEINDERCLFVNYDNFCADPNKILRSILDKLGISYVPAISNAYSNPREVKTAVDPALLEAAEDVFSKLLSRA